MGVMVGGVRGVELDKKKVVREKVEPVEVLCYGV